MSRIEDMRIITVAPTGAWPTKENNPAVPLTPEEIAADVYACWQAGAAVAHIHVRDSQGRPSMSTDAFRECVQRIRAYKDCDIILNLTTAGAQDTPDETRMAHIKELRPEMASYDSGSMNWQHRFVAENSPAFLDKLGRVMLEANTKPEIEVFDVGMIYEALYHMEQGALKAPLHFQFALGVQGGIPATVENLVFLLSKIPQGSTWGAFGVGKANMPIMLATLAMGGHLRVGFEDNVLYKRGVPAESNRQLVERAGRMITDAGYAVATPDQARAILGLK